MHPRGSRDEIDEAGIPAVTKVVGEAEANVHRGTPSHGSALLVA